MSDRRLEGWPNRDASRFVFAGGLRWHVQVMGTGPVVLLAHGTGAATHSWRGLAPLLKPNFTVVAPDLPGHGFTEVPAAARLSLTGMARATESLVRALDIRPVLAVGHSAGAAILLRMCLDGCIAPRGVVALNGALLPMGGVAGQLFSSLARLLEGVPMLPNLFAWRARDRAVVEKLLTNTGSRIDDEGVRLYARLMRDHRHAGAALSMMARWDLRPFVKDLPKLAIPLLLLVGSRDRAIPPELADVVRAMVPGATVESQLGLGHLAHEEDPAAAARSIAEFARCLGLLA
jgi:magnesium chelatase accessory protein